MIRSLNTPKSFVINNLLDSDTVRSVSKVNDKDQLYEYIKKDILNNCEDAQTFIDKINQRNAILSPNRKNQFVILKSNEDILMKDLFNILILDKPISFDKEAQSIIIIYNIKGNRLPELLFINNMISSLLHKDKLEFFDEDKNALPLDQILR
jgi:mannitol/fructose-specific phosphotransferase system IIA component